MPVVVGRAFQTACCVRPRLPAPWTHFYLRQLAELVGVPRMDTILEESFLPFRESGLFSGFRVGCLVGGIRLFFLV